ncbi:ABC transporter ATP-binding protein [Bradyrhizobium sp. HKCCYLRH3059]|uniref:ABC transporter ATP-binding protein n=1 Tax=Bradyrhizobium sp. HKCCYLRH3059 TaxID=3420745 RepID=UPI003EB96068
MTDTVLEATDLVHHLGQGAGRVQALKGVSLSLKGGELALLMGPSGSGKTTLLSILGCLMTPDGGAVRVANQPVAGLDPEALAKLRRERIGFIFQSYHLFPTLNAEDNVRLALDVRGERARAAKLAAREVLERVGLGSKKRSFPRQLSGGEQQRVAIARAIVGKAQVILADEPTGALDTANGQAIMTLLADIAKDPSRAVLVVTHDPRILPFANRVIHIEDGRIVREESGGESMKKVSHA